MQSASPLTYVTYVRHCGGGAQHTKQNQTTVVESTTNCVGNPVLAEEPISRLYFELYDSSDTCAYIPNRPLFMLVLISG